MHLANLGKRDFKVVQSGGLTKKQNPRREIGDR